MNLFGFVAGDPRFFCASLRLEHWELMGMTLKELREKFNAVRAKVDALIAKERKGEALSDEESASLDASLAEAEELKAQIATEEARLERATRAAALATPAGNGQGNGSTGPNGPGRGTPGAGESRISGVRERIEDDPWRGYPNAAEFARDVCAACRPGSGMPQRLRALYERNVSASEFMDPATGQYTAAPSGYMNEGSGEDGGFLVPPAMRELVLDTVFDQSIPNLLSMIDLEPTSGNSVEVMQDETTPWSGNGIQAYWMAEGAQHTSSKPTTDPTLLKMNKLGVLVKATDELLQDAPRLASRLTTGAGRAINYAASHSIFYGNGVGKPLGITVGDSIVTVAKEGSQTADTVVAANVAKMVSRLLRMPGAKLAWLINPDVFPQLVTMTLGDQPIWTPAASGFKSTPEGALLGIPVIGTELCKTIGDLYDIILFDGQGYYGIEKQGGVSFAQSIHLYFDYGVQAFRWTYRFGGMPKLSAPVSPLNGSNTRASFVALAARA